MKTPVAFIIFNRPDTTKQVFEKIREYQPKELFVIADGPRMGRPQEKELCEEARTAINVDWDCNVTYIYSDENLGCQKRISSGLDIVFATVEQAIILEDDCVPHMGFFPYCEDLLEKYENADNIMVISGNNFQNKNFTIPNSYYFSQYGHIWGWATWRRAWKYFDVNMKDWPKVKKENKLKSMFDDSFARMYWEDIFEKTYNKKIDSWAYPWLLAIWSNNGLGIIPKRNLVSNIGFGVNATHTKKKDSLIDNLPTYSIEFPLNHPEEIKRNTEADQYTTEYIFGVNHLKERALIDVKKCLFYEKLLTSENNILAAYKNIAIFGTKSMGRIIKRYAEHHGVYVSCFIDNNKTIQGKLIDNVIVDGVNDIQSKDFDVIIVSVEGQHSREIIKNLSFNCPKLRVMSWAEL